MRALPILFCLAALSLHAGELTMLRSSLDQLRKGTPAAAKEARPDSPMDKFAMTLPLTGQQVPWRAQFMAAEWLLLAHLERHRMTPVPEVTLAERDLGRAWILVQNAWERSTGVVGEEATADVYRGEFAPRRVTSAAALNDRVGVEEVPEALRNAVASLALEISVRLMRPEAMAKAAQYAHRLKNPSQRDKTFAMMAAAHGNAWPLALRWAQELAGTKVLGSFHQSAIANPESFDYSVLPDLAAPSGSEGPGLEGSGRWEVKDLRLRLRQVQGPEASTKALREALGDGWRSFGPQPTPFLRIGSAAHWQKPGQTPVPLTGMATPQGYVLRGYVDLPSGTVRKETLSLTLDPARPGTWGGQLVAEQPTAAGSVLMTFDAELDLTSVPTATPSRKATAPASGTP